MAEMHWQLLANQHLSLLSSAQIPLHEFNSEWGPSLPVAGFDNDRIKNLNYLPSACRLLLLLAMFYTNIRT